MLRETQQIGYQITEENQSLLELKIYIPYFISRSTVIEYIGFSDNSRPESVSIMDIL